MCAAEPRPAPAWARQSGHTNLAPAAPVRGPGDEALERILIAQLIARYGWCFDERDRAGLADCFAADAVWEAQIMGIERVGPFTGVEAIVDFLAHFWEVQADQRRHVFSNVVVDSLEGDRATAQAYLTLQVSQDAAMRTDTTGPYRFELVREPDGIWRMKRLAAGFDVPY